MENTLYSSCLVASLYDRCKPAKKQTPRFCFYCGRPYRSFQRIQSIPYPVAILLSCTMLARLLRSPVNWFMGYSSEPSDEHDDNDNMDIDTTPNDTYVPPISYEPTILDVLVVKAMLNRALRLPPEILDAIADWAEYWPHTSTEIDYTNRPAHARKDASLAVENQFLVSPTSASQPEDSRLTMPPSSSALHLSASSALHSRPPNILKPRLHQSPSSRNSIPKISKT